MQPNDYNTANKAWKKIRNFMDKMYPKHKKESKATLKKIDEANKDPVRKVIHDYVFKYVPVDALMVVLVLKAAKI